MNLNGKGREGIDELHMAIHDDIWGSGQGGNCPLSLCLAFWGVLGLGLSGYLGIYGFGVLLTIYSGGFFSPAWREGLVPPQCVRYEMDFGIICSRYFILHREVYHVSALRIETGKWNTHNWVLDLD